MFVTLGQQAMLGILSHLFFIAVTWWALQALRFDKLIRSNKVMQARLLYILLTVVIGSTASNFFLDYLSWSLNMPFLIQR
ncbi:MAG: DUF1146 family protein [Bacillus sp. (in: firmicutes)]